MNKLKKILVDNTLYELVPTKATDTGLGGVKAKSKTKIDTQEVHIDEDGRLYTLSNLHDYSDYVIIEFTPTATMNKAIIYWDSNNNPDSYVDWGDGIVNEHPTGSPLAHVYKPPFKNRIIKLYKCSPTNLGDAGGESGNFWKAVKYLKVGSNNNVKTLNIMENVEQLDGDLILPKVTSIGNGPRWKNIKYVNFISLPNLRTEGTYPSALFNTCPALEYVNTIIFGPYVTSVQNLFDDCHNLLGVGALLGTHNVKSMYGLFWGCKLLAQVPQLDTFNVTDMSMMFEGCESLVSIPFLNTFNVITMERMLCDCKSLREVPLLNTSKVTNMDWMFKQCESLLKIPQINTSNVTNMHEMFYKCHSLSSIPQLDTGNAINMRGMFEYCHSLVSIPQLNTSKVTDMNSMFHECKKLTTVSFTNTINVVDMSKIFSGCSSLISVSQIDTSNVTSMREMFYNCTSLVSLPELNTSKVTDMNLAFGGCRTLTVIPEMDTHNVVDMINMFEGCQHVKVFPAIDCSSCLKMDHMFDYCYDAEEINIVNINASLDIGSCIKMQQPALHKVIDNLMQQEAGTTKTLTLRSTLLSRVSDEYKLKAQQKGWTLA